MCGVRRKTTKHTGQRGTCQHSRPASQHTRNNRRPTTSTTWRAASQSLTTCRIKRDRDACVVLAERNQSRQLSVASKAGQHHTYGQRWAHNQHHMAGSKPITHSLLIYDGCRCMCGVGQKKTKQAGQRGTCQHSRPATRNHLSNKGTQQATPVGQQADHSRAADIGGIQMRVWGRAKENKAGRSEGHMPA
jgi:hypothetical protein